MNRRKIWGYGVGALGKDLANIVISSYLLVFYTNVLGISAAAGGTIMMVTKIWDAINDPMMGIVADKTKTRWGKFRPYLLFVPIPLAVCAVLTFTPVSFSYTGKLIWAAVTYTLTNTLFTCYDVPMLGMVPSLSDSPRDRNALATSGRFFTTIAILLGSTFAYPMIQYLGGGAEVQNLKKGYPAFLVILGVISIAGAWIAFASTKEVAAAEQETLSVSRLLSALKKNKPLYILQGMNLFFSMGMMVSTSVGAYYVMYVIGRTELISIYMLALTSAMTVSTLVIPGALKRVSKERFIMAALGIAVAANIMMFLFGAANIPLLLLLSFISNGCSFAPAVVMTVMVSDVADHTEYEKGYRADGVLFSINSFVIKLATAINSGLIGFMLTASGFDAAREVQSSATVTGINVVRYLYPIAAFAVTIALLKLYPLNAKKLDVVRAELKRKRGSIE